jgi:hypothetical protein
LMETAIFQLKSEQILLFFQARKENLYGFQMNTINKQDHLLIRYILAISDIDIFRY